MILRVQAQCFYILLETVVRSYKKTKMLYFFRIPKQNWHQNCVLGPMWFQVGIVSTSDIETTALYCYLVETDQYKKATEQELPSSGKQEACRSY